MATTLERPRTTQPQGQERMPDGRSRRPVWLVIVACSIPLFMAMLDNLIVTSALPKISQAFDAGLEQLDWIVNAYSLVFATFILIAVSLGDRFGRRNVFIAGIAIFTVASAFNAMSTQSWELITARAFQGIGGAGIMPISLSLLSGQVAPRHRAAAIGIWGGVAGIGVALGPLIGGWVTEKWKWEGIFWVNVPIGIVAIPLAYFALHNTFGAKVKLDLIGTALAGLGVLGIVYGIIEGNEDGWTSFEVLGAMIGGGVLLIAFVIWQAVNSTPLLPLRLFRVKSYAVAIVTGVIFSFGIFGSIFVLIQFLQVVQGKTPLEAGINTIPWTMAPMIVAPITGFLITPRFGPRWPVSIGLLLSAVGIFWISVSMARDITFGQELAPFLIAGVGMGMIFGPSSTSIIMDLAEEDHAKAAGSNSTLREIGTALGIAVMSAVFTANGGTLTPFGYVDAAKVSVKVGAAVLLFGALFALLLPGRKGIQNALNKDGALL